MRSIKRVSSYNFSEASGLAVTVFNKENLWLILSPILISSHYSDSLKVAVGKFNPPPPPPDPWDGVKRSKFNFYRTWSCCISNKRDSRMQQNGSKYFACRYPLPPPPPPPPDPGNGVTRSKLNFFRTWLCYISN